MICSHAHRCTFYVLWIWLILGNVESLVRKVKSRTLQSEATKSIWFFFSSFFTKLASGKIFIYRRLLKMKPILIEYIQGLPLRTILLSFLFVCFTLFGTNMLVSSSTNLYWSVGVSNYTLFLATFWKITTDHFFSRNLFQSETTRYESIFKETE